MLMRVKIAMRVVGFNAVTVTGLNVAVASVRLFYTRPVIRILQFRKLMFQKIISELALDLHYEEKHLLRMTGR